MDQGCHRQLKNDEVKECDWMGTCSYLLYYIKPQKIGLINKIDGNHLW